MKTNTCYSLAGKNYNRCIIHNTYPADDEPCWACVMQFGESEIIHKLLDNAILEGKISISYKKQEKES